MSSFATEQILTPHTGLTSEGFFIAVGAVVARCGMMEYKASELGLVGGDRIVRVWRSPTEVYNKIAMSSAEGKPILYLHPTTFIRAENWANTAKGHMQNVRPGPSGDDGNPQLLADLVIADAGLIEKVRLGLTDLSLGYDCSYEKLPDGSPYGDYAQCDIRINHCAVVPKGRANNTRIQDSKGDSTMDIMALTQKIDRLAELVEQRLVKKSDIPTSPRKPTVDGRRLTYTEVQDLAEERQRESNFAWGEAVNEYGRSLRERREYVAPVTQRQQATVDSKEENPLQWCDLINERGRQLRAR